MRSTRSRGRVALQLHARLGGDLEGRLFPDAPVRCGGSQTISASRLQHRQRGRTGPDAEQLFDSGRLHVLVRQGRTAGREDRRRIHAAANLHPVVRDLHGQSRRDQRRGPGQHPVALPRVERRVDMEPRAAVADFAALHDECVEHTVPLQDPAEPLRRLAAGRLEGDQPADAQPRRAIRRAGRRQL